MFLRPSRMQRIGLRHEEFLDESYLDVSVEVIQQLFPAQHLLISISKLHQSRYPYCIAYLDQSKSRARRYEDLVSRS